MRTPDARNSSALKPAWVTRWKKPAATLPAASAMSMYASCEMDEYASTRLMSSDTMAMVADASAVITDIHRSAVITACACMNRPLSRATRYTPAATMVAEWSSAETGVGPSIASGSQVNSGPCAASAGGAGGGG